MKLKTLFSVTLLVICGFAFSAQGVYAVTGNTGTNGVTGNNDPVTTTAPQTYPTLGNPLKVNSLQELLFTIVDLAVFLGTIIAVLVFIWIGFQFVIAQGNESKLKDAKNWFMYAAIGTGILLGSKVIVEVIKNTAISAGVVNKDLFNK